ncbi:MAG: MgtC/SapB family protein [Deltaproteobacteria bacterium]|nr:MgtC/SapB family protein [Deltaproteobacteria bacterium]
MSPSLPELAILFQRFGIALVLGMIIGIEREKEKSEAFAGIRTFPLIALMGCTAAMINDVFAPWVFAVSFIGLAAMVIAAHFFNESQRQGITTEMAAFLCFLFGGLIWWQLTALAAALAFVTVLLLATKKPLEDVSRRIGQQDIAAALQFGMITLIVLPILPNRTFGPLDVINPYTIWLMVVLIAGINFVGYVLVKLLGAQHGIGLAGLLGGIGSSMAVTLGFTRRSKNEPGLAPEFAFGIVIASAVMFARVLVEAFTVNPAVGRVLLVPIGAAGGAGLLGCGVIWFSRRRRAEKVLQQESVKTSNPFELWPAILFGLLFGLVLFIAKAAQVYLGTSGIYLSSVVTGLTDVDPIALSLSSLAKDTISTTVAARGITLAALANTAVKMLVTLTGAPSLFRYSFPVFGLMIVTGLVVSFTLI